MYFYISVFFIPLHHCSGGGIGRHAGLKILWAAMSVRVQFPSGAQIKATVSVAFFVSPKLFSHFL